VRQWSLTIHLTQQKDDAPATVLSKGARFAQRLYISSLSLVLSRQRRGGLNDILHKTNATTQHITPFKPLPNSRLIRRMADFGWVFNFFVNVYISRLFCVEPHLVVGPSPTNPEQDSSSPFDMD
jgi:hypothetical protein